MIPGRLNAAQLMMNILSSEQGKVSNSILACEFSQELKAQRMELQGEAASLFISSGSGLDLGGNNAQGKIAARFTAVDIGNMLNPAEVKNQGEISSYDLSPGKLNETAVPPDARKLKNPNHLPDRKAEQLAKEKIKGELSFAEPVVVEKIIARLCLPAEARQACKKLENKEGRVPYEALLSLLAQQTAVPNGPSAPKVAAEDVRELLNSIRKAGQNPESPPKQFNARSKGFYSTEDLQRLLEEIVEQAASARLKEVHGDNPAIKAGPRSSAATNSSTEAKPEWVTPEQVEHLTNSYVPLWDETHKKGEKGRNEAAYAASLEKQRDTIGPPVGSVNIGLKHAGNDQAASARDPGLVFRSVSELPGMGATPAERIEPNLMIGVGEGDALITGVELDDTGENWNGLRVEKDAVDSNEGNRGTVTENSMPSTEALNTQGLGSPRIHPASTRSTNKMTAEPAIARLGEQGHEIILEEAAHRESNMNSNIGSPEARINSSLEEWGVRFNESDDPSSRDGGENGDRSFSDQQPEKVSLKMIESGQPQFELDGIQDNTPGSIPIQNGAQTTLPVHAHSETEASLSTRDPRWVEGLSEQIRELHRSGRNRLTIELEPRELGRVVLRVEATQNQVTAWVSTDNEQARNLLLQNSTSLRSQLSEQGLTLGQFSVGLQQDQAGNRSDNYRQRTPKRRERNAQQIQGVERRENTSSRMLYRTRTGDQLISVFA